MIRLLTDTNALLGQSLGTCTIQRLIGRGGMGAVYLAQQTRPRREVAVKVLLPALLADQQSRVDFLARFRREADAIAALDHINIIPIYEYGEQEQVAYLVMPYVRGGSLRQILEKRGTLPLSEVLPILDQAAGALDYAHAKGIIHRDLKPGNILFHSDGRALLADFGLAKVLGKDTSQLGASALTRAGTINGTPEYLSPEQASGQALDHRTDIYSLGIILFQMLTGRVPFSGATPVATAMMHALSEPPSLSQLNPTLSPMIEAVVMKALAKQPDQRYESAGQLAQALSAAAGIASARVPEAVQRQAIINFAPKILLSQETLPEAHNLSVHGAETVVDMGKIRRDPSPAAQDDTAHGAKTGVDISKIKRDPWPAAQDDTAHGAKTGVDISKIKRDPWPAAQDDTAHGARTGVDISKGIDGRISPAGERLSSLSRVYHPAAPQQHASWQAAIFGVIFILLLIISGLLAYVYVALKGPSIASLSHRQTPLSTAIGTATPTVSTVLPAPEIPAGKLLYGTSEPGYPCDSVGGSWSSIGNAHVTCGPSATELANTPPQHLAGMVLKTMANGQQIPSDYILQVQVRQGPGSHGAFGILFRNQANSSNLGAYAFFLFPNNTWSSKVYDDFTRKEIQLYQHQTTIKLQAVVTITIRVQGDNFVLYIQGRQQGYATSPLYPRGTIGLVADTGANVFFSNFAIYTLPNK